MAHRKTIRVAYLLEKANRMLASDLLSQEEKAGICCMIEGALHVANVYNGFSYLPSAGLTNPGTNEVSVERQYDRKYCSHPSYAS